MQLTFAMCFGCVLDWFGGWCYVWVVYRPHGNARFGFLVLRLRGGGGVDCLCCLCLGLVFWFCIPVYSVLAGGLGFGCFGFGV